MGDLAFFYCLKVHCEYPVEVHEQLDCCPRWTSARRAVAEKPTVGHEGMDLVEGGTSWLLKMGFMFT
jgi:hypothetical protein